MKPLPDSADTPAMASTVAHGHSGNSSETGYLKERVLTVLAASLCFAVLWISFNWPALHSSWWALDDYSFLDSMKSRNLIDMFWSTLRSGRPFMTLMWVFKIIIMEMMPSFESANITMRLLQGGTHVAIATIIGITLVRLTGRRLAYWTALPFLLWPFGGGATYWLSAAAYPIAGLLSLVGVLFCMRPEVTLMRRSFGMGLIMCSIFTNQSAALLGLVFLWMCMLLSVQQRGWRQRFRNPLLSVILTYMAGAGISVALGLALGEPRVTGASLPGPHALWFLVESSLRFLLYEPALYPLWMQVLQVAMVIIPVLVLVATAFISRPVPNAFRFASTLLLGMIALAILPYIPLFLIGLEWLSGRLMYAAPLLFSTTLCMIFQWRLSPRTANAIVVLLLIGLLAGYYPISRTYAEEHIATFENDLRTLRELEGIAAREGVSRIAVATDPQRPSMINPYQLRYSWFDESSASAFSRWWAANWLITKSSRTLKVIDIETTVACVSFCQSRQDPNPRGSVMLESPWRLLCFCA